MSSRTLFLTWIAHRRTAEIAERLDIPLATLTTAQRGLARYARLAWRTLRVLRRERPKVLIVQSPSLVLSVLTLVLRPFFGYAVILDAHNEAVEPYLHPHPVIRTLTYWALRKSDLVIVSNPALVQAVEARGGHAISLPDRIPQPPEVDARRTGEQFRVAVISTFAGDEPIEAVIEAARRMTANIEFHITGNPAKLAASVAANLPHNVKLTGFLPEHDYWTLLAGSDLIMDLTTMEDCLVCGAYEGVAVERPLVLSGNRASRELFHDAALFTDNSIESIADTVREACAQHASLLARLPHARRRIDTLWEASAARLVTAIQQLAART